MIRIRNIWLITLIFMSGFSQAGFSAGSGSAVLEYYGSVEGSLLSTGSNWQDSFFGLNNPEFGSKYLSRPVAVAAIGPTIYIADADDEIIYRYDTELETLVELLDTGAVTDKEISSIFVDVDGSFYVSVPATGRVHLFDPDGRERQVFENKENLASPVSIALKNNGDIIVADGSYDRLVTFNNIGWALFSKGGRGDGPLEFNRIVDIAQQRDTIYLVDTYNDYVQHLTLEGKFIDSFKRTEVERPSAIAADREGRVYISDRMDDSIKIYHHGKLLEVFGSTGMDEGEFNLITDMWIDQDLLYIADSLNARIQILRIISEAEHDKTVD